MCYGVTDTKMERHNLQNYDINFTFNGAVVVSIVVTNRAFKYACVLIIKNQRLKAVQDKIPMIHNNV